MIATVAKIFGKTKLGYVLSALSGCVSLFGWRGTLRRVCHKTSFWKKPISIPLAAREIALATKDDRIALLAASVYGLGTLHPEMFPKGLSLLEAAGKKKGRNVT